MTYGLAPFFLSADVDPDPGFWAGIDIGTGSTAFLLSVAVLLVIRGWLVPRRVLLDKEKQLTDERADHDAEVSRINAAHAAEVERIAKAHERELAGITDDRNQWRSVAHLKDEAHRELARSVDQMTDAMRSINAAFVAFPEGVRRAQSAMGGEQNA